MIQRREQLRLPRESGHAIAVAHEHLREKLYCDVTAKLPIACAIHLPHTA